MGLTITKNLPFSRRRGWIVQEFEKLWDAGFFEPEAKLELIEGEIFEKMTQNEPHAVVVALTQHALNRVFTSGFAVRAQAPMIFGPTSKPEPDVAVLLGSQRDYLISHPKHAVLIVEISDSTLIQDQQTKASLYAREGIEEYWIVNLVNRVLEVRRQPAPMNEAVLGFGYRSTQILLPGESVSPLAAPEADIQVNDLLP